MTKPRKWKTTTGAIMTTLGGILLTASLVPNCPAPSIIPWLSWIGGALVSAGGPLMVVGVAHRVDKAAKGDV